MKTSLTERIEQLLHKKGDLAERLLLEAQIQVNTELAEQVDFQKKAYKIIREYGKRKLREEINLVDKQLFENPKYISFQHKILSYFKKQ
ncbi:MAG: hypothetical protein AAGI07_16730 [Bacteroidota bacterium]